MEQVPFAGGDLSSSPALASEQAAKADEKILTETGFFWRQRDGVKVLVCRELENAGFLNGFSTRLGGVSPFGPHSHDIGGNDLNLAGFNEDLPENIHENRRRFLALFDGELKLSTVWQVHSDVIKQVATNSDIGNSEDRADALISKLPDILIGVKTADCVPVLIGDRAGGAFAAVHAGWSGTALSIVRKSIEKLNAAYGSNPPDLIAAIGPAAGCTSYEIGSDVIEAFAKNFDGSDKYFVPTREGHALVDLHEANRDQLIASGVNENNIYAAPLCTIKRPDLFFSYRLEKHKYGKTGRLLSVIGRSGSGRAK